MQPPRKSSASLFTLLGLSAAPVCALLLSGCGRAAGPGPMAGPPGGAMPPPEVSVVEVTAETVPMVTELPGRIDATRVAEVRARATGIVLKRLFEEGADVKQDQTLFEIDPALPQANLDSAKASLARAEANLKQAKTKEERTTKAGAHVVSQQDYDDAVSAVALAEADVSAAKASVAIASLNLSYTRVTAPISGRIGWAKVTEGALVSATEATPMATIQSMDPIYFDFTQSSTDLLKLRREVESGKLKSLASGQAKVTLMLEDGTKYQHPGKLLFTDISVDKSTGMVTLRAEVPNPDRILLPGMFVRGQLEQAVDTQALTLPQRVVARGPNGSASVMVVNNDNKVEVRQIKADLAVGNKWVVSGDVKAGDRVIAEGVQKVTPGGLVKTVPFTAAMNTAENSPAPALSH